MRALFLFVRSGAMRVRRNRMLQHYNERTYRAIEAENARSEMARQEKKIAPADPVVESVDTRTAEEIARAAAQALKGHAT